MTAFRYSVRHPSESGASLAFRRAAMKTYCFVHLPTEKVVPVSDPREDFWLGLCDRSGWHTLTAWLKPGDHLVSHTQDLGMLALPALLDRLKELNVTLHLLDLPAPIPPGRGAEVLDPLVAGTGPLPHRYREAVTPVPAHGSAGCAG